MLNLCGFRSGTLRILLTASTLVFGCAFAPSYQLADDAPKSGDFTRLVLLPMNFDQSPNPALAPGAELMEERTRRYLEASGYEVVVPRMSTTLALWKACTEAVGGIADVDGEELIVERYERARSDLVRRTLESNPADGVVSAAVMVREGRYSGFNLRWDGVERPVPIDMGKTNLTIAYLNGTDAGISLRISVFDRNGRKIFERYVGLEPLRRYQVVYPRVEISERKDLFQDDALIEEVIALSFQPWLVPAAGEVE